MSVSGAVNEVGELTFLLIGNAKELEDKCGQQAAQIDMLTNKFAKSRLEAIELRNRIKTMEEEAVKLKPLLLEEGQLVDNAEDEGQGARRYCTGKNPIDVFPEKVWSLIFEHLKEPQDLKSCYQTCTKFMWMLQEKTTIFLFLDVLKIMQNQEDAEMNLNYFCMPGDAREFSAIINCRQVCYSWKQSVDSFLQEECPIHEPVDKYHNVPTALQFTLSENPWTNDPALRNLPGDKNPMVSRYLALMYSLEPDPQDVTIRQNAFREFLQKFGHHVWHFKVCFTPKDLSFASWYASFLSWLRLMPNLKSLHFHKFCISGEDGDSLEECLSQNPFPTFQSLTSVALDFCPAEILGSILTANSHVDRLQFCGFTLASSDVDSFKLDKLKDLTLDNKSFTYKTLEKVSWNLSKVTLNTPIWNWSELFRSLEQYAGTLTHLDMQLAGPNRATKLRLYLPNVRNLKLEVGRCFNSLDFIVPLVNLENLTVDLILMYRCRLGRMDDMTVEEVENHNRDYVRVANIEESVQIHGYIHDMRKSNIWRVFPNLKKVMVRSDHFEYEDESGYKQSETSDDENESDEEDEDATPPFYDSEWKYCSRNQVNLQGRLGQYPNS